MTKLTYFQLESHLNSKNLATIYIVSSDELLLKQEAIQWIRKAAKQAGFVERHRFSPEAGFDWNTLHTLLYATSFFAEKRLIELDFRDSTPNKTAGQIIQEYASNPSANNLLLIDVGKLNEKISKSAWYKSLEKSSMVVNIWPLPREQLPSWIQQRAKKYNLNFAADAANLLADYMEGNLVAIAQLIEKIYLLKLEKSIDIQLLKNILTDESRFTIFDLVDNLIAGDKTRSLRILDYLQQDDTEPTLILWAITRELRLLADSAQQLSQGETYANLFQKQRIFPRRQTSMRRFLTAFSAADCWHFLSIAAQIDTLIKGGKPGNVWDALQLFCLRMV